MGNGKAARGRGERSGMKKNTLIFFCRQYLAAGLLQFVDILIDLFLGALICRVLDPSFVLKGLMSCKSII